jgi:uncharacterized protein YjbI with pentapeptide repeats
VNPGSRARLAIWLAAATLVLALVLVWVLWQVPFWLATSVTPGLTSDQVKAVGDVRASLLQLLSILFLAGGLAYTARTFSQNRISQADQRFAQATQNMANEKNETVRIGGIQTLSLLAQRDQSYAHLVDIALASFLRQRTADVGPGPIPADMQEAAEALGRRPKRPTAIARKLDLRKVNLQEANLVGCDFRGIRLDGAVLINARFTEARLCLSSFREANMSGARLTRATLNQADCTGAELGCNFYEVKDATRMDITEADLSNAINLSRASRRQMVGQPKAEPAAQHTSL